MPAPVPSMTRSTGERDLDRGTAARWPTRRRSPNYTCSGPRRSSTADLAWAAGSRWHIEECVRQAKGEAGLDLYQVRAWRARTPTSPPGSRCRGCGRYWHPDPVSKRFKKLAAQAGVPVVTLHEGGRHTGNSLMQDAGVDRELRMREVGHADRSVNDRYTHPLEQAHLAASEQTATLVRNAGKAS